LVGSRFAVASAFLAVPVLVVVGAGAASAPEQTRRVARPADAARHDARRPAYRMRRLPIRVAAPTHVAAPRPSTGRLYIVQRAGRIRIYSRGRLQATPFLDLRRQVSTAGEQGMFAVAFHPNFAGNGLFYVCYTDRAGAVIVAEYRSGGARAVPESARTLVRVRHDDGPLHNGGQIAFGPDGRLYVGIGDGGYTRDGPRLLPDPHQNAQNLNVLLGKIFALDVSAAAPRPEIVAYGLRNPWRFSVVPGENALIVGDVGWTFNEEIDYLPLGTGRLVNFGWSVYEGRRPRGQAGPLNRAGELRWPVRTYDTNINGNCSITGGFVYRGSVRALQGRYLFGDYCSGRIWSIRLSGGRASGFRREPLTVPRLASFGEDARGELYAVSLERGRVYQLVRR
jgi:glucose/arabinose dehydrogenase